MTDTPGSVVTLEYTQGSSDKFYRVFTVGDAMTCQYGRNGTYGSFTPRKAFADGAAAQAAALKTVAGKVAKGYVVTRTGETAFDAGPSDADLDRWAGALPAGDVAAAVVVPQERTQAAAVLAVADGPYDPAAYARVLDALDALDLPPTDTAPTTATPLPMLAQNVEPSRLDALLDDPAWVGQPKLDGDRLLVEVVDGVVRAFGRNGQAKASNVGAAMLAPFRALTAGRWVFDGEIVGRTLWLFDLAAAAEHVAADTPFRLRHAALVAIVGALAPDPAAVGVVGIASGAQAKRTLLADAESGRKEGVMFRDGDAAYRVGRSSALLRHKFVKTLDAVVVETGRGGKQTAVLGVHDHDGTLVRIGNVTTIGKGGAAGISVGQVVEVAFLYVVDPDHPVLYQPRILAVRTDKTPAECSVDQLLGAHTDRTA